MMSFEYTETSCRKMLRNFVAHLLINRSSIDPKMYPLEWLTCAVVRPEDVPWYVHWYVPDKDAEASGSRYLMQTPEPMRLLPHWSTSRKRCRQSDEHI
jgi:hypothetical protein